MQTRDVRGQKMPKNANVIWESSLMNLLGIYNSCKVKYVELQAEACVTIQKMNFEEMLQTETC